MKKVTVHLKSLSAYGQSRFVMGEGLQRGPKEGADDHEKRTWKERCHYDENGHVFIPPISFKNCLQEAAKFLGRQIPGRGKERYTKHFEAGIMVLEGLTLPVTRETLQGTWLKLPSDGTVGGTKRVSKCMPTIASWEGEVVFYVLDDTITKDVFEEHLREAGQFIGLGYWRPSKRGMWGRFACVSFEWEELDLQTEQQIHAV